MWGDVDTAVDLAVEAVDLAVDTPVDLAVDTPVDLAVEPPAVADLEVSPVEAVEPPALVDVSPVEAVADCAETVDRQRLPPKRPGRIRSGGARATAPAPSAPTSPWLVLSAAAIARAKAPTSPTGGVAAPRPAIVRAVDPEPPHDVEASPQRPPDGVPPELVERLRRLVSRRR